MATMDFCTRLSSSPTQERVKAWLQSTPPESPEHPASPTHSRKRSPDADMERNSSPKRRRIEIDEVLPAQSASQAGSISVVGLSERTTFTPPRGSKRSSSPTRNLADLRTATPSVSIKAINQLRQPLPANVVACLKSLRSSLGRREGLDVGYIPIGLRNAIESDPLLAPSLDIDPIDAEAYDYDDKRPAHDPSLVDTLYRVRNILQNASHCTELDRDENAWCFRVIWPLIELAMKLHTTKFNMESVQSQSIQPHYLPTVTHATPASPNRQVAITRKTDFCFSYSCFDPEFAELYTQLAVANTHVISHTLDNCTQRLALFSGIEVKPQHGDLVEAELQMSIWMAASLRNKLDLAHLATDATTSTNEVTTNVQLEKLFEPAIVIIGNDHKFYYAYPSSANGDVTILGPDEKFASISTRSVQGIFKLIQLYARILAWGYNSEETSDEHKKGQWETFLGPVLRAIAKRR